MICPIALICTDHIYTECTHALDMIMHVIFAIFVHVANNVRNLTNHSKGLKKELWPKIDLFHSMHSLLAFGTLITGEIFSIKLLWMGATSFLSPFWDG